MDREYQYWAWLAEGETSADTAREVIRTWESPEGYTRSEGHTPDGWQPTWTYRDVRDQHERGYLLPITAEDAERRTRS